MLPMFLWMACGLDAACPPGWTRDAARDDRLAALVGHPIEAPVCFGTVPEKGLWSASGRFLLDGDTDDRLLAARLVHLEIHRTAPAPATDCRERLLQEEAEGWLAELAHRRRLGVADPSCPLEAAIGPAPALAEVREWVATSSDVVATGLRESHRDRCAAIR